MEKSISKDMTKGSPMKLIFAFFLPLMLGMLFQQFYSMMDTIIVGKFLGVNALAAVGCSQFYGNWILHGHLQRVCDSGGTDVRGKGLPLSEKIRGKRHLAGLRLCRCHDRCGLPVMQQYPALDGHAGGYPAGSL